MAAHKNRSCAFAPSETCSYYRDGTRENLKSSYNRLFSIIIFSFTILLFGKTNPNAEGWFSSFFVMMLSNLTLTISLSKKYTLSKILYYVINIINVSFALIGLTGVLGIIEVNEMMLCLSEGGMFQHTPFVAVKWLYYPLYILLGIEIVSWLTGNIGSEKLCENAKTPA